ncbi:MAG: RadC family protein [Candidatus Woesearchaeota archaeon]
MKIKEMPWWNRPSFREVESLNPAELLSLIIWCGDKNNNAIDVANKLLKKYSLSKLYDVSLNELEKEVGKISARRIKAMYEIFKLTEWVSKKGFKPVIEKAEDVYNMFASELGDKKKEYLYALLLDTKNRVIKKELVSIGTLNSSLVHPREVFKEAIKNSANSIILVHNHPSGDCEPSIEDKEVTFILKKAANLLKINLLDHVIISSTHWYTFSEQSYFN